MWYRESMRQEAERLGVVGWVRNLDDGRVEAVVEGPGREVDRLMEWCEKGPAGARVREVEAKPDDGDEPFDAFLVRR